MQVDLYNNNNNTHTFNDPAGTRKVKPIWILTKARDNEWQWHPLGHMQVCTLLQTDNHASTHRSVFYGPDALSVTQPTALKH